MPPKIQYSNGDKIGRCLFIKEIKSIFYGEQKIRMAIFKCECGNTFKANIYQIKNGNTTSCGCYRKKVNSRLHRKHGEGIKGKESPEYVSWQAMITRCYNKKQNQYKDYGGRGIVVCDKWRHSFELFLNDVGRKPTINHSLDRWPDKNGNYEPSNVRWATREDQQNNKRSNKYMIFDNQSKTIIQWAREWGIKPITLYHRVTKKKLKKCYPCTYLKIITSNERSGNTYSN